MRGLNAEIDTGWACNRRVDGPAGRGGSAGGESLLGQGFCLGTRVCILTGPG